MAHAFETLSVSEAGIETAPDGSTVRVLLRVPGGSMAHFTLGPHQVSRAVAHKTIDEIWYFLEGVGQMWRGNGTHDETIDVSPGVCITIPAGTSFQFRTTSDEALVAIGQTMPPWPGDDESSFVDGVWPATVSDDTSP